MRAILTLLLAAFAAVPLSANASDAAAAALEGAWVVMVGDQPRDRFLVVTGARAERNEVLVERTAYGFMDGKARPVDAWRAEIAGDSVRLSFTTSAESRISVTLKSTEESVLGEMLTKAGKRLAVRMTRLAEGELEALRAAAKGAAAEKRAPVPKTAMLYLLYVGADDCLGCQRFVGQYGGDGSRLTQLAPELAEARFTKVNLVSFRSGITAGDLPDELKWTMQRDATGKVPLRRRGAPFFAAIADQRILAQGHGLTSLETIVAPALKQAVEQKRAAN